MAPLPQSPFFVPDPACAPWWPADLGTPQATGSQNGLRYACFGGARRLAVDSGGDMWVYDALDHQIGGFGQQQEGGSSITLSSQYGTVPLTSLPVVWRRGQAVVPSAPPASAAPPAQPAQPAHSPAPQAALGGTSGGGDDVMATLERLAALKVRGLLSDEEFQTKKRELLDRL